MPVCMIVRLHVCVIVFLYEGALGHSNSDFSPHLPQLALALPAKCIGPHVPHLRFSATIIGSWIADGPPADQHILLAEEIQDTSGRPICLTRLEAFYSAGHKDGPSQAQHLNGTNCH